MPRMINVKAVIRRDLVLTNGAPEIVDDFATRSFPAETSLCAAMSSMREEFPTAKFFEVYEPVTDHPSQRRF